MLGTCLAVLALNIAAGAIFYQEKPAKPGYAIAVKKEGAGAKKEAAPKVVPLPVRLAKASVEKGKSDRQAVPGLPHLRQGRAQPGRPQSVELIGEPRGEGRGFNFSSAMKAKGGKWTYEELDKFLTDPRGYIPGTAMTFAGIKNDQQRADVIAFCAPCRTIRSRCPRRKRPSRPRNPRRPPATPPPPRRPGSRPKRRSRRRPRPNLPHLLLRLRRPSNNSARNARADAAGSVPGRLLWGPIAAFSHGNLTKPVRFRPNG